MERFTGLRSFAAVIAASLAYTPTAHQQGTATSLVATYFGLVNEIMEFIDPNTTAVAASLSSWDNSIAGGVADSIVVFRLVTNVDVMLTATSQEVFTLPVGGGSAYLATYYQISASGNGSTGTGFLTASNGTGVDLAGDGGDFVYVGGGSTAWETVNSETAATFLAGGETITHINKSGAALLTVTIRGVNGEDAGANSDNTEAPEAGTYTADLSLLATVL